MIENDEEYMPETDFDGPHQNGYTVQVGTNGVTVWSECCGDTMRRETAALLYKALGEYLDATGDTE